MHHNTTRFQPSPSLRTPAVMPPVESQGDLSRFPESVRAFLQRNEAMSLRFCSLEALHRRRLWLLAHWFRCTIERCTDVCEQNAAERMGVPEGLAEMYCSDGCMDNSIASPVYKDRVMHANKRYRKTVVTNGGRDHFHPMAEIRFVVAHTSTRDTQRSCAAWEHNTAQAINYLDLHVRHLNRALRGSAVNILTLADTDTGALTLFGPSGEKISVQEALTLPTAERAAHFLHQVSTVFPATWDVFTALREDVWQSAFHAELADSLVANAAYVEYRHALPQSLEPLQRQERLLFVGRPLELEGGHALCIEDREPDVTARRFREGLPRVAANVICDALEAGTADWQIPVVIGIPHDPMPQSEAMERTYARQIWYGDERMVQGLLRTVEEHCNAIADATHAILDERKVVLPTSIAATLPTEIYLHLVGVPCLSDRRTRLLRPFQT